MAAPEGVRWLKLDAAAGESLEPVRRRAGRGRPRGLRRGARAGDDGGALDALGAFRLLCASPRALRRRRLGAAGRGLAVRRRPCPADERWYPGRPLLITENDYGLRLFNGDTGVVVRTDNSRGGLHAPGRPHALRASRLEAVETVHSMTIHKAQGSVARHRGDPAAGPRLLAADPRDALHGDHAGEGRADPRRHGGRRARRGRAPRHPRVRPRGAPGFMTPMDAGGRPVDHRGVGPSSEPVGPPRVDGALRRKRERRGGDGLRRSVRLPGERALEPRRPPARAQPPRPGERRGRGRRPRRVAPPRGYGRRRRGAHHGALPHRHLPRPHPRGPPRPPR